MAKTRFYDSFRVNDSNSAYFRYVAGGLPTFGPSNTTKVKGIRHDRETLEYQLGPYGHWSEHDKTLARHAIEGMNVFARKASAPKPAA